MLGSGLKWSVHYAHGSGWHGITVYSRAEDGTLSIFGADTDLDVVDSQIDAARANAALMPVLSRIQFQRVGERYVAEEVADGTQAILVLQQRFQRRVIYFSNQFPTEFRDLATALQGLATRVSGHRASPIARQMSELMWLREDQEARAFADCEQLARSTKHEVW